MSNPCEKNSSLIKEEKCNGQEDKVSYTPIENGYCLGRNCIDEQNIQRLRLTHMDPYEGSTPQKGTPPVAGDFRDPFTKRLVKNREIVRAGIRDPTEKSYEGDHDYNIDQYRKNSRRVKASNRIRRLVKSRQVKHTRKWTPESFYENLLNNISPISGETLYNNKQLPSDASYMKMIENVSPEKSPLYERSIHLSHSKTPTPKRNRRNAVDNVLRRGTAFGGTRKFK